MSTFTATCANPSRSRYVQGCRCDACTLANTEHHRQWRGGRRARLALGIDTPDAIQHGTISSYTNYGCRCIPCSAAKTASKRQAVKA